MMRVEKVTSLSLDLDYWAVEEFLTERAEISHLSNNYHQRNIQTVLFSLTVESATISELTTRFNDLFWMQDCLS